MNVLLASSRISILILILILEVLTVWVALVDATPENGCMQMVKGGHASGKTGSHTIGTTTSTWYTELGEDPNPAPNLYSYLKL